MLYHRSLIIHTLCNNTRVTGVPFFSSNGRSARSPTGRTWRISGGHVYLLTGAVSNAQRFRRWLQTISFTLNLIYCHRLRHSRTGRTDGGITCKLRLSTKRTCMYVAYVSRRLSTQATSVLSCVANKAYTPGARIFRKPLASWLSAEHQRSVYCTSGLLTYLSRFAAQTAKKSWLSCWILYFKTATSASAGHA